jgi:hypothetical protein
MLNDGNNDERYPGKTSITRTSAATCIMPRHRVHRATFTSPPPDSVATLGDQHHDDDFRQDTISTSTSEFSQVRIQKGKDPQMATAMKHRREDMTSLHLNGISQGLHEMYRRMTMDRPTSRDFNEN